MPRSVAGPGQTRCRRSDKAGTARAGQNVYRCSDTANGEGSGYARDGREPYESQRRMKYRAYSQAGSGGRPGDAEITHISAILAMPMGQESGSSHERAERNDDGCAERLPEAVGEDHVRTRAHAKGDQRSWNAHALMSLW